MIWRREDKRDIVQCTVCIVDRYVVNRYVVLQIDNRVYGK